MVEAILISARPLGGRGLSECVERGALSSALKLQHRSHDALIAAASGARAKTCAGKLPLLVRLMTKSQGPRLLRW